ncbi:hypothetical protein [Streptomyces sp. NPDC088725]|uniref:hypothetical protein n=1 Tax=Streptomyces sp. NPDC088725 TaxID=3365873 RepID=UPI0038172FFB
MRRYAVGAGQNGVVQAVFVDTAVGVPSAWFGGLLEERPQPWAEVQLQDSSGGLVGRFDPAEWLPEAADLPHRGVHGEQLLARSGVSALLAAAGIPLYTARDAADPRIVRRPGRRTAMSPGPAFPHWYTGVRASAGCLWFAAFTLLLFSGATSAPLVVTAAAAALSGPSARLVLRGWTRRRRSVCPPVVLARISPRPAVAGEGAAQADGLPAASVRFCLHTELRVQKDDLVLKDLAGSEYWLPRRGPHAVVSLRQVSDHTGALVGIEFLGPDTQTRALLPWDQWFGGLGGHTNWAQLRQATALPVQERRLSRKASAFWPRHPVLGSRMVPVPAREARALSRFPSTAAGVSSTAIMAFGSLFSVMTGARIAEGHPWAGASAVLMGAAGALLQATPYLLHQLRSRRTLERPAPTRELPIT